MLRTEVSTGHPHPVIRTRTALKETSEQFIFCGGIGSIIAEAPPMEDEARRGWRSGQNSSALQAEKNFGHRKRSRVKIQVLVKVNFMWVQGLGCRLGRCFCALHIGVHRTPAPCRLDHTEQIRTLTLLMKRSDFCLYLSFPEKLQHFSNIPLHGVVAAHKYLVP